MNTDILLWEVMNQLSSNRIPKATINQIISNLIDRIKDRELEELIANHQLERDEYKDKFRLI